MSNDYYLIKNGEKESKVYFDVIRSPREEHTVSDLELIVHDRRSLLLLGPSQPFNLSFNNNLLKSSDNLLKTGINSKATILIIVAIDPIPTCTGIIDDIGMVKPAPDDTVFVDRQTEVRELALCSLKILSFFKRPADSHNNVVSIPLATQMWGSGKTKLGECFIECIAKDRDGIQSFLKEQGPYLADMYKNDSTLSAAIESLSQHVTVTFNFKWLLSSLEIQSVRTCIAEDGWTALIQITVLKKSNIEAARVLYKLWRDIFLPFARSGSPVYVSGRSSVLLSLSYGLYREHGITSPDKSRMIHIVLGLFDHSHIHELLEQYHKGYEKNGLLAEQILQYTSGVPRLIYALVRLIQDTAELSSLMNPPDTTKIVSFFERIEYTTEILPITDKRTMMQNAYIDLIRHSIYNIPINLNEELDSQTLWGGASSPVLKSTLVEHYHLYITPIPDRFHGKRGHAAIARVDPVTVAGTYPFIISSGLLAPLPKSSATSSPTSSSTSRSSKSSISRSDHYVLVKVPLITIDLLEFYLKKSQSTFDVEIVKDRLAQLSGCRALGLFPKGEGLEKLIICSMANRLSFGLESKKLPVNLFLFVLEDDFKGLEVTADYALKPFVVLPRFLKKKKTKDEEDKEYIVEEILDEQVVQGRVKYLVRWKGHIKPTWEPYHYLEGCEAMDVYEDKKLTHSFATYTRNDADSLPRTATHDEILDYLNKSPTLTIQIPLPKSHSCDLYFKLGPRSYLGIAAKNTPSKPFTAGVLVAEIQKALPTDCTLQFVLLVVATHTSPTLFEGSHRLHTPKEIRLPKDTLSGEANLIAYRFDTGYMFGLKEFDSHFPKGIPFPVVILTNDGIEYFLDAGIVIKNFTLMNFLEFILF
eukprot:gene18886-22593_t